jgi:hypothetical protein
MARCFSAFGKVGDRVDSPAASRESGSTRVIDSPEIPVLTAALRRRVRNHNLHVLMWALLSLGAGVILWMALYVAASWLTLLVVTIWAGVEGRDAALPTSFNLLFGGGALLLLAAAWLRRLLLPQDRARDSKSLDEHFLDIVLTIPAITLGAWWNLTAWLWLSDGEIRQASRFLAAVLSAGKLPLTSTPLVVPEEATREKIVMSLLLLGVVESTPGDGPPSLRLARSAEHMLPASEQTTLSQNGL